MAKKKPDYSKLCASVKVGDYVAWLRKKFATGELTHADVFIVFENRKGTKMKWGKGLPQPLE